MPHAQAKSGTSASPADLEALLERLEAFNLEGVSGTQLEADGLLHFVVEHGQESAVHDAIAEYHPRWTTDVFTQEITAQQVGQAGVLRGIVQDARAFGNGRPIDTVLTGVSGGVFYVQVTFVGSNWTSDPPQ